MIIVSQSRVKVPDNPGPAGLRLHQPGPGQLHHRQGGGGRGGVAPVREAAAQHERSPRPPSSSDGRNVGDQDHPGHHQAPVGQVLPQHPGGPSEWSQQGEQDTRPESPQEMGLDLGPVTDTAARQLHVISYSLVHSHWSRNVEARLSLRASLVMLALVHPKTPY